MLIPLLATQEAKTWLSLTIFFFPSSQTVVTYSTWAACQSSSNFYQPAEFSPERWLESANYHPSSPFASDKRDAFQPFGMGPRKCLGQVMAWAEMRLILARLLWTFDIKPARELGDWNNNRQQSQIMWAMEPFEVQLRRRKVHSWCFQMWTSTYVTGYPQFSFCLLFLCYKLLFIVTCYPSLPFPLRRGCRGWHQPIVVRGKDVRKHCKRWRAQSLSLSSFCLPSSPLFHLDGMLSIL